jgi:DnaJ-class molecular chaperone
MRHVMRGYDGRYQMSIVDFMSSDGINKVAPGPPKGNICPVCDGLGYNKLRRGKCYACHGTGSSARHP